MPTKCPKCSFESLSATECTNCGINFVGYNRYISHNLNNQAPAMTSGQQAHFLADRLELIIQQNEDDLRIFTGWQTCNHYTLKSSLGETLGYLAERKGGFANTLSRLFLRTHRPLIIDIANVQGDPIATLYRNFYWLFSELLVIDAQGNKIGAVCRRFGFFRKIYTLYQPAGVFFVALKSTLFGGRTVGEALVGNDSFGAVDASGADIGAGIHRKWNGALNRLFTDEDSFLVELNQEWSHDQKLVFLAASISIDFDFYEDKPSVGTRTGVTGAITSGVLDSVFGSRGDG